jgi:hypothetical protein
VLEQFCSSLAAVSTAEAESPDTYPVRLLLHRLDFAAAPVPPRSTPPVSPDSGLLFLGSAEIHDLAVWIGCATSYGEVTLARELGQQHPSGRFGFIDEPRDGAGPSSGSRTRPSAPIPAPGRRHRCGRCPRPGRQASGSDLRPGVRPRVTVSISAQRCRASAGGDVVGGHDASPS